MKKEVFTEYEAEKLLKKYLPVAKNQLVKNLEDIKIKVPLVLKIISKQALHKSDVNGVRIIKSESDLEKNFNDLIKISKKKRLKLDGILVQEFIEGHQLIVGGKKDEVFGPIILFGGGGIFTEIMKDISIRVCPISRKDALDMINEIKFSKILRGYRGQKANINSIINFLIKFSKFMVKHSEIIELDVNPLIANTKGVSVVDARIVFEK